MPYDISYEYDAAGNRIRKVDNLTAAVTTYTYDAANQLATEQTAVGTTNYTFDRAGNMETITTPFSDVTTYVWDAENRRTAVQTSGGTVEAAYNADGLRVRNGDTRFLWDGQAYLAETNTAVNETTLYTVQPSRYGRLISEKRSAASNSEWFHFDALGSIVNISTPGEGVPERYVYDAWGNLLSSNSFKPTFLYVGQHGYYADGGSIGGYYVRARYYDGRLGRFQNYDPKQFTDGPNLFVYSRSTPTGEIDPSGEKIHVFAIEGAGGVGVVVAGFTVIPRVSPSPIAEVYQRIVASYGDNAEWHYYGQRAIIPGGNAVIEGDIRRAARKKDAAGCCPRIVLLGFSWGGNSVYDIVRGLERNLAGIGLPPEGRFVPEAVAKRIIIDLVFTIDPVLGDPRRSHTWRGAAATDNYCQWISFYQTVDTGSLTLVGAVTIPVVGDVIAGANNIAVDPRTLGFAANEAHMRLPYIDFVQNRFQLEMDEMPPTRDRCCGSAAASCPVHVCVPG